MYAWENRFCVCEVCRWMNTCSEMPDFVQPQGAAPTFQNKVSSAVYRVFQICRAASKALYSCRNQWHSHQNVKLMLLGARLHELNHSWSTYHHLLAKMVCNPPLPDCYLGKCEVCPGIEPLKQELYSLFDENMIDSIT